MKNTLILIISITSFMYCTSSHNHDHTDEMTAHDEENGHDEELILTLEQAQNIGIQYDTIASRALRTLVQLNGHIELLPGGRAMASSPLEGQIREVHVIPGQYVRRGDTLFTMINMDLVEWQESYLKSKADIDFTEKELARQVVLQERGIAPEKNVQSLEAEKEKLKISLSAIREKLNVVGISESRIPQMKPQFYITAPQSGVVQHVNSYLGSYVKPETYLLEIINNRNLRIHLYAYAQDVQNLRTGQEIEFYVTSRPDQIRRAVIVWINNIVNEENYSYEVHARILGEVATFSSGEYVSAYVISDVEEVPSIPETAIATDNGLSYIFARHHEDSFGIHFKQLHVETGESERGYVEIRPIDPLTGTEQIVTKGSFFLMAQAKKESGGGGGHHH